MDDRAGAAANSKILEQHFGRRWTLAEVIEKALVAHRAVGTDQVLTREGDTVKRQAFGDVGIQDSVVADYAAALVR